MPTTTPTQWLPPTIANFMAGSSAYDTEIVGLSNGNFVVVWTETNNTIAPAAGTDIVGVIFDAQGNPISDTLLLNSGVAANGSESQPAIAATDDGGFVLAFTHERYISGAAEYDNDILFARFDAAGVRTQASYIVNDATTSVYYSSPSIVARGDGTFFVSYERTDDFDNDILGVIIGANGAVGSEINIRQDDSPLDDASNPREATSATLTNGTVVTVFLENDGGDSDIEIVGTLANGTFAFNYNVTSTTEYESHAEIAALTGGGFVVVWERDGNIYGQLFNSSGGTVGAELPLRTLADDMNEPVVIGLEDGGFFVAWDDDTDLRLEGRRYDSTGAPVGNQITIANADVTEPEISLTNDGRILVVFDNYLAGAEEFVILDPRNDDFTLHTGGGAATTRQEGGTVYGDAGADSIFGQGGIDTIYGLSGDDTLFGGNNRDYLGGGAGNDTMIGGQGNDVYVVGSVGDVIIETPGNGEDSVRSTITYTLDIELEHLNLLGNANLNGFGNNKDNILQGNGGRNIIYGFKGDDTIKGFDNRDGLIGNDGADRILGMQGDDVLRGDLGADVLFGGAGNDRFVYRAVTDSKVNASQRDTIMDFVRGADKIDLRQIDASSSQSGDQAFAFISDQAFSGGGGVGEVRFVTVGSDLRVEIDTDGNGTGDMHIMVENLGFLSASDFLL